MYDVAIIGGGPAGLAAALQLGRARRRVLLLDAGEPRNARAHEVHGFLTRDGTPPREMRRLAHEELARYPSVERGATWVDRLEPLEDRVRVHAGAQAVEARRVLLATGMVDELPELPGLRALWGESVFQCPYCHGWEHRDEPWAYWARTAQMVTWPLLLRAWTSDVVVLTGGAFEVPAEARAILERARMPLDERPLVALHAADGVLAEIELAGGRLARRALYVHPPQRQVALVTELGLALDDLGFLRVDDHARTSSPRIHAAGDAATMRQSATIAAGAGALAGATINHLLMLEAAGA